MLQVRMKGWSFAPPPRIYPAIMPLLENKPEEFRALLLCETWLTPASLLYNRRISPFIVWIARNPHARGWLIRMYQHRSPPLTWVPVHRMLFFTNHANWPLEPGSENRISHFQRLLPPYASNKTSFIPVPNHINDYRRVARPVATTRFFEGLAVVSRQTDRFKFTKRVVNWGCKNVIYSLYLNIKHCNTK